MHLCQKFWWKGWVFEACLNDVLESEWWRLYGESFKIEGLTHKNYLWPNALEPEWGILRMRVSAEEWRSLEGVCRWMTEWTNEWWFMMRLKTSTEVEEVQRSVVVQCLCRVLKRSAHDVMPLPPCSHVGSLFKTSLWERLQDRKWQCSHLSQHACVLGTLVVWNVDLKNKKQIRPWIEKLLWVYVLFHSYW